MGKRRKTKRRDEGVTSDEIELVQEVKAERRMRQAAQRFVCYVCGTQTVEHLSEYAFRRPVGWEQDDQGRERCPKHRQESPTLVKLGDFLR